MKILNLENKSKIPLYIQIYNEIKRLIVKGDLVANTKLPSKKNLMQQYNLSQSTIQNALYLLMEEGYIFSEERRGYFVSNLENLIIDTSKIIKKERVKKKENIKYDFSYSGVDIENLPKNIFKKINKEIYEEGNNDLAFEGEIQGDNFFRQTISSYLSQSRGVEVDKSQIIISSGSEYLFHIIFKIFENPKYGLENPGYKTLQKLFTLNKINYAPVSLDQEGILIQELLEKEINIPCITPSHQFPTGIIMSINRRRELLNWANKKENRYIIEDDYDSEFKYNGRPIPALKAIDYKDKVIYIGSFSKSITPSFRVSYMVLPKNLLAIYQEKLPYSTCSVSTLSQKMLYKFIEQGYFTKHLNKMRTIYKKKREFLISHLREESIKILGNEVEIQGADAGLHLIIKFPTAFIEEDFLKLCNKNSLKIYSLQNYYLKSRDKDSFFLLGYASLTRKDIQEGITLLVNLAKKASISYKNNI